MPSSNRNLDFLYVPRESQGQPGGIPLETETTQELGGRKDRNPEDWPKNIWEWDRGSQVRTLG